MKRIDETIKEVSKTYNNVVILSITINCIYLYFYELYENDRKHYMLPLLIEIDGQIVKINNEFQVPVSIIINKKEIDYVLQNYNIPVGLLIYDPILQELLK